MVTHLGGGTANGNGHAFYGGVDPADLPRYTYPDASRATKVPISTIAAWVRGMPYTKKGGRRRFESVIERPIPEDNRLSFNNLVEVHVLRALREVHEVRLSKIREAIRLAKEEHGIDRLLIDPQLRTTGGALFLDYYLQLVELSPSHQLAMRSILRQFLQRVRVDESLHQATFYPTPRNPRYSGEAEPILVSPVLSFGNAIIGRVGVSTNAIASRLNVGEAKAVIIEDYGLNEDEFEEAILYEAAA